tara:strand:- start:138335 stop:140074 length:1740 start_codon:yes stop_codon:yes gene_type:complete
MMPIARFFIKFIIIFFIGVCLVPMSASAADNDQISYQISGVKGNMLKNVNAVLKSAQGKRALNKDTIQDIYQQVPENVKLALQPFGYFRPTIKTQLTQNNDTQWTATLKITAGPALPVADIKIDITGPGTKDPAFKRLLANLPLKQGEKFTTKQYDDTKQSLFAVANNNGYIDAKLIKQQVSIDLKNYRATVTLELATGIRYYFGTVHVTPNFFSAEFIKRYLNFKPGEVFSPERLLAYQQNLNNSGFFQQVMIKPQQNKAIKAHVPIEVTPTPVKPQRWQLGGGYGTDTGIRGSLGWQWRRITDDGQHFSTSLSGSAQIGINFNATYFIPGSDPLNDLYTITTNIFNYSTDAGKSFTQNYGVNYLTSLDGIQQTASLSYINETYNLTNEATQHAQLIMPSLTWMYLDADNPLSPTKGVRVTLNVRGSQQGLLSSTSFIQSQLNINWVRPLVWGSRIVAHETIGATGATNFSKVPLSIRFTAGGAQSVRAYGYQALGPGKFLIQTTEEFQQRVYGHFYVGGFFDAGNAFNNFNTAQLLKTSAGPVVVWDSPVGSLELSVAKRLSSTNIWSVEFSMGTLL